MKSRVFKTKLKILIRNLKTSLNKLFGLFLGAVSTFEIGFENKNDFKSVKRKVFKLRNFYKLAFNVKNNNKIKNLKRLNNLKTNTPNPTPNPSTQLSFFHFFFKN